MPLSPMLGSLMRSWSREITERLARNMIARLLAMLASSSAVRLNAGASAATASATAMTTPTPALTAAPTARRIRGPIVRRQSVEFSEIQARSTFFSFDEEAQRSNRGDPLQEAVDSPVDGAGLHRQGMRGIEHLGGKAVGLADRFSHLRHVVGDLGDPGGGALDVPRDHVRGVVLLLDRGGHRRGETR